MDLDTIMDGADRFAAYVEELTGVIGHADRAAPLRDYCAGLLTAEPPMWSPQEIRADPSHRHHFNTNSARTPAALIIQFQVSPTGLPLLQRQAVCLPPEPR